jgi:hypothetical protein
MSIIITKDKKIREVQQDFNSFFPYLQVEFFIINEKNSAAKDRVCIFDRNKKIGEFSQNLDAAVNFIITPGHKLTDLEKELQEKFGLSVQIFRKSGRVWLDTVNTNSWTLEQQNRYGEELNSGQGSSRVSR